MLSYRKTRGNKPMYLLDKTHNLQNNINNLQNNINNLQESSHNLQESSHNLQESKLFPCLYKKKSFDFSSMIIRTIFEKDITFYSSNPTIIEYGDKYLLNLRWINYNYNEDGSKKTIPSQWISLNSRFILDDQFTIVSEEQFLKENFQIEQNNFLMGIEDIRLFKTEQTPEQYHYLATCFDSSRNIVSTTCNIYPIQENIYELERNIILPTFYDTNKIKKVEKNWSFLLYKDELSIIYVWYPLHIGKIEKNVLNLIETKTMPHFFKDARGSTPGYRKNNEIWFILHKAQTDIIQGYIYLQYQHFFSVFDLDMNLLRYSELFKLGDKPVEFCTGLIIKDSEMILSYSILDTTPIISVYDMNIIYNLKWEFLNKIHTI